MSLLNDILDYQQQKLMESKESTVQMIEAKIRENIDKHPFSEYIILHYDNQYTKEMDNFLIDFLTKEGFYVDKYYADNSNRELGLLLLTKEQKDKRDLRFKRFGSRLKSRDESSLESCPNSKEEHSGYCNIQ